MTEQEKYLRDEIAWLLGGLTFTAGHGRFLGGHLSMVEFCMIPVNNGLGLRITPALPDCCVTITYTYQDQTQTTTATTNDRGYAIFPSIHPASQCVVSATWSNS